MIQLTPLALWMAVEGLAARGTTPLLTLVLARRGDGHELAGFSFFIVTVSTYSALSAMGVGVAATRFVAEVAGGAALARIVRALIVVALMLAAAGGAASTMATRVWSPEDVVAMPVLTGLCVGVTVLDGVLAGILVGLREYRRNTGLALAHAGVLLAGSVVSMKTLSGDALVAGVACSYLFATVGRTVGMRRIVRLRVSRCGGESVAGVASFRAWSLWCFSGPMTVTSILVSAANWVSAQILVAHMVDPRELAVFSIGMQWHSLAAFAPLALVRLLVPEIVHRRGRGESPAQFARRGVGAVSAIGLVAGALVVTVAPVALTLYGAHFQVVPVRFVAIFVAAAVAGVTANALGSVLVASVGPLRWTLATAVQAFLLIAVSWMQRAAGAEGQGVALLVANVVLAAIGFAVVRQRGLI